GFAWFTITFLFYTSQKAGRVIVIEEGSNTNDLLQNITDSNDWQLLVNWTEYKINLLLPYLSVAYLFVLLWFSARLLFQIHAANQLKKKGIIPIHDELKTFTDYLASSLGITKNVLVYISSKMDIPATIGFLKPVILLPATAVTHLTPAQLEAVLLHELAHIRRNDYFWNILLSIAETLLFFNPFALLLINIARKERENSCDDVVMSYQQNAAVYAEALLNVEKARLQTPVMAMALGDNKQHLMHRVKRILNLPTEKSKISTRLLALLFFTVVFALMGWVLQTQKQNKEKEIAVPLPVSKQSLKKEFLHFSPDALVKEENKALTVRDAAKKINLNIQKNQTEEVYVIRNDQGEEFQFNKIIFEDLPKEWFYHFVPDDKNHMNLPEADTERKMRVFYLQDSLIHEQSVKKQRELEALYQRSMAKERRLMKTPKAPMRFTFKGHPFYNADSIMEEFYQQQPVNQFNFEWNGELPFVMMRNAEMLEKEKEWTDKVKQTRKKTEATNVLIRKRIPEVEIKKMKLVDSLLEKTMQLRSFPEEWMAVMQPVKEELKREHPQLTIIIENNLITVNGTQIAIDSGITIHPQVKKQLRMIEFMRQ
ncbi:MAG TPA: M56 family metallopeptidase, partial [Lacibacter sp.]|nr:M56 family metallopeptidase [Lacibacter sp.]